MARELKARRRDSPDAPHTPDPTTMKFTESELKGAFLIEIEPREDERGFFARAYSAEEFRRQGLNPKLVQTSISYNRREGTLRGMHYQAAPKAETKLVRCTAGAIYDVIIDLRPDSPTFKDWIGVELTARNHRSLYIPEGFAHGFITLADETEVSYQITDTYAPEYERGVRWDDPAFAIRWPVTATVISERDRKHPDFREASP